MQSIGLPELVVLCGGIVLYGFPLVVIWKFYQMVRKITENTAAIRQTLENGTGLPRLATPSEQAG
jgi:hypothetical protein